MVHHVVKPMNSTDKTQKKVISQKTQEQEIEPGVTLRRTTVEEIEVRPPADPVNIQTPGSDTA